jgi:outer membrane protein assembly factor BamB
MNLENGPGPHATPVLAGERLFTVGAVGRLQALDKRTGKVVWVRELWSDLHGTLVDTGYSSSPLAYRDTLILPVGGPGRGVVALRQSDGSVVWQKHDFENSPASPTLIQVGGQDQVVVFMAKFVAGLDPITGDLLWQHPHDTKFDLNISTPAWDGKSLLFCSSAYDVGSRVLELTRVGGRTEVKQLWANRRFRVHKDNAMWIGGRVYGWSGDFGPSLLTAADGRTGSLAWQDRTFAKASFLYADGKLIALDEDGNLGLATLTATGPKVLARYPLMKGRSWTVPTLVGTRLFVRDREEIVALELG